MSEIRTFVDSIFDELVAIRRDIHAHPETGMQEVRTSALIRSELEKMGVDEIQQPLPTAVVALIHGKKGPGKCVALRADIDALPVHEESGVPFASEYEGKMHAEDLENYIQVFYENESYEHTVFPGAVYVSLSTEYGTLYSKAELAAIHAVCQKREIPLFVDGARLAYALAADERDITLPELAQLCDVFYIGGTKCGALCGEAVVFPHGAPAHFMTMVKQQGALLAKGRLLGLQFAVLFTDDLYTRISRNAIETADRLKEGLAAKGYRFYMESPTNQVFPILANSQLEALEGKAKFGFWEKYDDTHTVMRIATSWATRMEEIEQLIDLM